MHKLKSKYITLDADNRLHGVEKPLIGLTGGIATGKSTASSFLRNNGVPLIDADQLIHEIYAAPSSIDFVAQILPQAVTAQNIDFSKLREAFFNDPELKNKLEQFLYAKLPSYFRAKLESFQDSDWDFIIYDVPLLFEKELQTKLDQTLLIYCDPATQIKRLMQRDGSTQEQAEKILSHQIPIDQKRARADFVIDNSRDIEHLELAINHFLGQLI